MAFQPLTQQQYKQARQVFSNEDIIRMEDKRKKETEEGIDTELKEPSRGFLEDLIKRPVERLVIEPGVRTTQAALAVLPGIPQSLREGALEASRKELRIDVPIFGEFISKGLDEENGFKQILGEAAETIAWLYVPARVGIGAVKVGLREGIKAGARFGAKAGAIGGGLFGGGEALQEGAELPEVALRAGIGAVTGVAAGGAFGGAVPVLPLALQKGVLGVNTGGNMARSLVKSMLKSTEVTADVAAIPLRTATRVATRAAEQVSGALKRREDIKNALPHIGEAMKQGIEDPLIRFLQFGSIQDKMQRVAMLDIAKSAVKDLSVIDQAKRLPGKTILEGPVKFLIDSTKTGTKKTQELLDFLPKKAQDVTGLYDQFVKDMRSIGVEVQGGKLVRVRGSRVPDADLPFYKQIFNEFRPGVLKIKPFITVRKTAELTYKQMDALRDRWFQTVKKDQTFTEGVRGKTGYLNRVRALLTKEIDKVGGGQYRAAQQQTAESLEGLREFVRILGYKGDLDSIIAKDLKAGEVFIRAFGNAADRPTSILEKLYLTAKKYGYTGKEDVLHQLRYADMLESVYGQPSRSIGAQIQRSISATQDPAQTTASGIREMVKWSPYAGIIRLLKARGFLGRSEEEVILAFENLIRGEAGLPPITKLVTPLESSLLQIKERGTKEVQKIFPKFKI